MIGDAPRPIRDSSLLSLLAATLLLPLAARADLSTETAELLMPFSQLNQIEGGPEVLTNNLATALNIQNGASQARRNQAMFDATSPFTLATTTVTGLGDTFANAYWQAIVNGNPATRHDDGSGSEGSIRKLFNAD